MEKKRLKILSYNIHKGFTATNADFALAQMREAIRTVGADLVFLQEVLGEHEELQNHIEHESQFEYLADSIWSHYAYGKNAVYSEGHHGNAILSKYPVVAFENIDITFSRFARRGMLHVTIEVPDQGKIHAIVVHLGLFESERREQIRKLCERIQSHVPAEEPLIIAGDFNDWLQKATPILEQTLGLREAFITATGSHAKSFPAWLPALRLDRVYFRGMEVLSAECLTTRPWSQLSDHAALLVEMRMI